MHYEIYIDTLFLLNFCMNLYLLELTNCILHHTATWKRILFGAFLGAAVGVLPFILPVNLGLAAGAGFLLSALLMGAVTFRVARIQAYLQVLEYLLLLTILLGAVLLYILKRLPQNIHIPVLWIFLAGGFCFLGIRRLLSRHCLKDCECKVTLSSSKARVKVNALIDTGNTLIEPISGAPVAVLDKNVFDNLFFEEKPGGFRVIPYRSIDKKAGILPGYLIPEVRIEWKGFCRVFQNIYVGVRKQDMEKQEKYKMIINPDMLKERKS